MKLFIEAEAITKPRLSGIGHTTLEIIRALIALNQPEIRITLIVPYGTKSVVAAYGFTHVRVRTLPPGQKIVNYVLARTALRIPVDLWFGRGVYLFPDYKNWFVPFSRSVTCVYDVAFRSYPQTVSARNLQYLQKNMPMWIRRTNRVVTISHASADEIGQYYPSASGRLEVVSLGANPAVYYPRSNQEISEVRRKYSLPDTYFLAVGNIEPRKNTERLLDAYKLYADAAKAPAALVIIGGGGWNNDAILAKLQILQEQGYPIFHPQAYVPDSDLPAIYSGATTLLHVAVHEGFGLPPIEALACGLPVIASDIAALREVLPANTTFVSPTDTSAIAASMQNHQKPHTSAQLVYTWENTARRLVRIMEQRESK